ncbi:MAG: hypothetical protein GY773_18440, partial [Actinomycetia bacterium]|nr:hypothetical protein [Actinomycetes bacterium]
MLRSSLFLAAALFTVGCGNPDPMVIDFGESNATGRMAGDMATVRGFDDDLTYAWVDAEDGWTFIEMHVAGEYGWAMIMLDLNETLGQGALAPGRISHVTGWEYYSGEQPPEGGEETDGEVEGGVIGCSGPEMGDAEYDEESEDATVEVQRDPETGDLIGPLGVCLAPSGDLFLA